MNDASDSGFKMHLAGVVTLIAIAGFAGLTMYMLFRTGVGEPRWTRLVYLLTGVETVMFVAVGWLFGKEVGRGQADLAKEHARSATQQAQTAQQEASQHAASAAGSEEKGRALAAAVKTARQAQPAPPTDEIPGLAGASFAAAQAHFDSLTELANRLYPDA